MTDWDKINRVKNLNIILGRSQNQALEVLIKKIKLEKLSFKNNSKEIAEKYQYLVEWFFKENCKSFDKLLII